MSKCFTPGQFLDLLESERRWFERLLCLDPPGRKRVALMDDQIVSAKYLLLVHRAWCLRN